MGQQLLYVCLFAFIGAISARSVSKVDPRGGSCILNVNKDLPTKNEPLLLERSLTRSSGLDFVLPETEGNNGIIALREGQEILIACPGARNFLAATQESPFSSAVCSSDTGLIINGRSFQSTELDCNSRAQSAVRVTSNRCANGKGVIVELGFEVNGWTKLMESCHNLEESKTYYSLHTVHGDRLAGKVFRPSGTRPGFSRGDRALFNGFNPEHAYTQRNQQTVFSRELGASRTAEIMGEPVSRFLSRGHLAPDADFLFSPHQFLTYFYVNVAPQWQQINAGNWLRVEENTRRTAIRLGADLDVLTGTYGVLQLEGSNGLKEIKLQGSRLPVPELFWKVLRNTQDDSCIAFVASNDPFSGSKPRQLCTDVCSKYNWPVLQNDLARGYIYCCEYSQIKKAIPEIPNITCKSPLRGRR